MTSPAIGYGSNSMKSALSSLVFVAFLSTALVVAEPALPIYSGESKAGKTDDTIVSDREKVELIEDSNVAEALSRRPDLDFRNVTIDGEVSQVDLKDIPTDQVESAQVSKAVTPDLDADLRGGGLNLRSKPTFNLKERVLKGELGTSYKELLDEHEIEGSLTYGQSMGRWGFMGTVSVEDGLNGYEQYSQDWIKHSGAEESLFVLENQRISANFLDQTLRSANGTVDFKVNEAVRLYVKGSARERDVTGYNPRFTLRHEKGVYSDASMNGAVVNGARAERYFTGWEHESRSYSLSTGGYLDFETISLDYHLLYNHSNSFEPDWFVGKFIQDDLILMYDLSEELGPSITVDPETDGDLEDPSLFINDWISRTRWEQDDTDWISTVNATIPVSMWGNDGFWKSGFKLRGLDFIQSTDTHFYDDYDGLFRMDQVLGSYSNPDILGGRYNHGPFPGTQASREFFDENMDGFSRNVTRSHEESDSNTYDTQQDIYAGYSMLYLQIKRLKVIAGLRYEQTEIAYNAYELVLDEDGEYLSTNLLTDSNDYANWFPGIHGRYDVGKWSFIGSWSNTISRPDFDDVVPFRNVNREAEFIKAGNPDLKPTQYTKYDFAIDYKYSDKDMISLELFYQTVEDIEYYGISLVPDGPYMGYEFGTRLNGPSGEIYGVRLIWSQSIGDWLEIARGLSLNAQYTYQVSETSYPGRPGVTLPMPGSPENDFELNLTFKRSKFFAQLELDFRGSNLRRINDEEIWHDRYAAARSRLNFSSSFQMTDTIRVLFEVRNLIGNYSQGRGEGKEYFGDRELLAEYGYDLRTYRIGMIFDL